MESTVDASLSKDVNTAVVVSSQKQRNILEEQSPSNAVDASLLPRQSDAVLAGRRPTDDPQLGTN